MVTGKIGFLALLSILLCGNFEVSAKAVAHLHHGPRRSIKWRDGCAFYPMDEPAVYEHKLERDCATALSFVTGWPKAPEECDYDYGKDLFLGPERVPSPRLLPLRPGKFLIELHCGAGGLQPSESLCPLGRNEIARCRQAVAVLLLSVRQFERSGQCATRRLEDCAERSRVRS